MKLLVLNSLLVVRVGYVDKWVMLKAELFKT